MSNSNTSNLNCPVIAGISITTDKEGRYNLNALHKASGGKDAKRPKVFPVCTGINRQRYTLPVGRNDVPCMYGDKIQNSYKPPPWRFFDQLSFQA